MDGKIVFEYENPWQYSNLGCFFSRSISGRNCFGVRLELNSLTSKFNPLSEGNTDIELQNQCLCSVMVEYVSIVTLLRIH